MFEVGCGSGSNLYFFKKDGFKVGGLDYAQNLLDVTRKVIGEENLIECVCGDASEMPTDKKYDAVFASGVFQYLNDLAQVEKTLDKMLLKAKKSIAIIRMLKAETKDEYFSWRRKQDPNYDERYKDLPRLFISRDFIVEYAAKNNLELNFNRYKIEEYWNDPYIFDCYLYKK